MIKSNVSGINILVKGLERDLAIFSEAILVKLETVTHALTQ